MTFRNLKSRKTYFVLFTILSLFFLLLIFNFNFISPAKHDFSINNGTLDLQNSKLKHEEVINLSGEWEFYWEEFLTKQDFYLSEKQHPQYVEVPNVWNDYSIKGKSLPGFGYATYRLRINNVNQDNLLAIRMPTVSTAYNFYVDDELLSSNGSVSKGKEGFRPEYQPKTITFMPKSKDVDIIIHISNFSYARGGMWYPIYFGSKESIQNLDEITRTKDLLLTGAFLLFCSYHLIMFLLRRNQVSYLLLVFLSLCAIVRVIVYGDYTVNYFLPQIGYNGTVIIDYLSMLWFPSLGALFVEEVFGQYRRKRYKKAVLLIAGIFSATVVILPISVFTQYTFVYQLISVALGLFAVILVLKNFKHNKIESVLLFVGAVAITMSGIHDTLYQNNRIHSSIGEFSPVGFLVFLFCQSFILAIRNKWAYDELSEATEKLKQLDSMKDEFFANTAHELRTPLNAIINVSEGLYREVDGPLGKVQKENLSLVINSGKRLALMVNDILDYSKLKNAELSLNLEGVSVQRVVDRILSEMKRLVLTDRVQVLSEVPENIPNIYADQNRLIQILYNIIGNAIKNTNQGRIVVKATAKNQSLNFPTRGKGCAP